MDLTKVPPLLLSSFPRVEKPRLGPLCVRLARYGRPYWLGWFGFGMKGNWIMTPAVGGLRHLKVKVCHLRAVREVTKHWTEVIIIVTMAHYLL